MRSTRGSRKAEGAAAAWLADLHRYREDDWLTFGWWVRERTFWAVTVFRLGQLILERTTGVLRQLLLVLYSPLQTLSLIVTGVELPPSAKIGPGLRIVHGGNIVINPAVVIGARCVLRQGVTIGKNARTDARSAVARRR